jgi:iron complex transport system substrate-binding protein
MSRSTFANRKFVLATFALSASLLVLTGCSPSSQTPEQENNTSAEVTSPDTSASPTDDALETTYPLTVDTCGTETTFAAPPQKVVTAKSSTMEMMLALGVGDRIIGTTYQDGPLPAWLTEAAAGNEAIETPLSDKLAGTEVLLELEPDLIYVGWESNLSADGMGERDTFESLGVNTLVAPSACKEPGYQPDPLTYEDVFNEIELMGQIFDRQAEASQLVENQKAELEQVTKDERGLTALWYSSGSDTPFVGGGKGSAQLTMDTIGLTNIAADIEDTWGSMSWEKVIEADPDVIVLVDSAWGTTEKKIGVLEGNPATAKLTAVQNERYLVVPFPATEAGVRSVSAATELSAQLADLSFE